MHFVNNNYVYFIYDNIKEKKYDDFVELNEALKKSYPNLIYEIVGL